MRTATIMKIELTPEELDIIRFLLRKEARQNETPESLSDRLHALADRMLE